MLVEQCALMHMIFRNSQGVHLFEHVRSLEPIEYIPLFCFQFKRLIHGDRGEISIGERFCAGSLAGATAQTIIYPMEVKMRFFWLIDFYRPSTYSDHIEHTLFSRQTSKRPRDRLSINAILLPLGISLQLIFLRKNF